MFAAQTIRAKATLRRRTCIFGTTIPFCIIGESFGPCFRARWRVVDNAVQERQTTPEEQWSDQQRRGHEQPKKQSFYRSNASRHPVHSQEYLVLP